MYKKTWSGSWKVLVLLIQTSVLLFLPVLLDVVVVLFNLPNIEVEWKLSVPEQLLILKNRKNSSFDNEAIWTRLLMTFSVLFIFLFLFFFFFFWRIPNGFRSSFKWDQNFTQNSNATSQKPTSAFLEKSGAHTSTFYFIMYNLPVINIFNTSTRKPNPKFSCLITNHRHKLSLFKSSLMSVLENYREVFSINFYHIITVH